MFFHTWSVWRGWRVAHLYARNNIIKINARSLDLRVGCWNVRTLLDKPFNDRPERRTALLAREVGRLNMDVVSLSETRLAGEGQREEVGGGYTFFWRGNDEGGKREAGVGFAVRSSLISSLSELPVGISERLMTMRMALSGGRYATFISVYAPTMQRTDEEK